jgi:hypothetical protein
MRLQLWFFGSIGGTRSVEPLAPEFFHNRRGGFFNDDWLCQRDGSRTFGDD